MKDIVTKIQEGAEYNPSFNSHKKCWNNFIKWYDGCLHYMEKDEILDLLQTAIREIEDDSLDEIK